MSTRYVHINIIHIHIWTTTQRRSREKLHHHKAGVYEKKQDAHHLVGQAKRCATKIRPKVVRGGIFDHFSNFDKCQWEVAGDVISGVAID